MEDCLECIFSVWSEFKVINVVSRKWLASFVLFLYWFWKSQIILTTASSIKHQFDSSLIKSRSRLASIIHNYHLIFLIFIFYKYSWIYWIIVLWRYWFKLGFISYLFKLSLNYTQSIWVSVEYILVVNVEIFPINCNIWVISYSREMNVKFNSLASILSFWIRNKFYFHFRSFTISFSIDNQKLLNIFSIKSLDFFYRVLIRLWITIYCFKGISSTFLFWTRHICPIISEIKNERSLY